MSKDDLNKDANQQAVDVDAKLALIKAQMPLTYEAIKVWSKQIGKKATEQVRRGLLGEYRCFWAYEAGHVMGEIWHPDFAAESAVRVERFGVTHVDVRLGMGVVE